MLSARRVASLRELCAVLGASERTVRRDLARLALQGVLERTHGGARLSRDGSEAELAFRVREHRQADEKRRIAKAAAGLVRRGSCLIIDSGTTALQVARALPPGQGLTVLTNSVPVAWELALRDDVMLVMSGGTLRGATLSLMGPQTDEFFGSVRADLAFIGASALSLERGLMNSNLFEAGAKKAMIRSAGKVVLVADRTKFEYQDFSVFAGFSDVDVFITDGGSPPECVDTVKGMGVMVIEA
ncbi:MAG: DeoR/GlpR transcriptional regulator [Firmicutes bacterium]|nr:DeoR/GlpR transcriptional regulator [Bacillota bacterium]